MNIYFRGRSFELTPSEIDYFKALTIDEPWSGQKSKCKCGAVLNPDDGMDLCPKCFDASMTHPTTKPNPVKERKH